MDFKNLVDQLTSPTKTEQIEEDLYYFEKVTHKNDEGFKYTEFAIWNCYCEKDSSDEWDYDTFEKDIYLEIKYFDTNNNEVSESEFDDFYDNDPNSTWEIQFISNNLNDVKEKMSLEISSFKKLHEKKGILNTKKPIQFKSNNSKTDNNLPAYENLLGVELFKKDISGLNAYCRERPNMGDFFKKLTNFIRNGYSVVEVLSSSDNDINDPEIRQILATGFRDISNFLKSILEIKENHEVRKDYDACLEAIEILESRMLLS